MRARLPVLVMLLFFTASCADPQRTDPNDTWYGEALQQAIKENDCRQSAYGRGGTAIPFLLTPDYLVTWCERLAERKPGKLVCHDPPTPGDAAEDGAQLRILACKQEYVEIPRDMPSYDLIVLTARDDHEWRACPKVLKLDLYGVHPLWIERNPKPYGETFALSQFWVAKSLIEETEYVDSEAPADGHALLYGDFFAGQILYCHEGRWVMSGYH